MPADPHLRPFEEENPPFYDDKNMFTVVIEHNGFFVGHGDDMEYIQPTAAFVDYINTETWSLLWIEEILKQLGYEKSDRMHVYWQLPGKSISDGVLCIQSDADIVEMIKAVKYHKTLCIMVDHTNCLKDLRAHVIINGGPPLPPVISPRKIPKKADNMPLVRHDSEVQSGSVGPRDSPLATCEPEPGNVHSDQEEDAGNPEFVDSDYEPADGDDNLYADNIDKEVNDHNEHEIVEDLEDDDALEDEDLNIGENEQEKLLKKLKAFNSIVDMKNPEFKVGMVFADVKELRAALRAYSISNRVPVDKKRNETSRINARCKPGCSWSLKASKDSRSGGFIIRSYQGKHSCVKDWEVNAPAE